MDNDHLHSPRLPDSPSWFSPSTPPRHVSWGSDEEDSCKFSEPECHINIDSKKEYPTDPEEFDTIDLTQPLPPPKKLLTDYYKRAAHPSSTGRMPYFLQSYNPRPTSSVPQVPKEHSAGQSSTHESQGSSSTSSLKGKNKRSAVNKTYSLARKFEVLNYVAKFSESEAARHFDIPRTTIRGWKGIDRSAAEKASLRRKGKNLSGAGRPLTYGEELDMSIYQWILEMRDLNLPVQAKQIKRKAIEMIKPTQPTFKASAGWLTRFKTRHSLALRRQTSVQQKLPAQLELKLTKFLGDLKVCRVQHKFPPALIINMDETPMCFDMPSSTTIDVRGKKEVLIRGTGAHKRHFTVTLACTAAGEMLKPFITFKAKTDRTLKKVSFREADVVVTTQAKGWMDSQLMLKWIQKVLVKHTKGQHALLVFDTFRGHLTADVQAKLAKNNILYMAIPGGCTSKIQPLDVCLNKPFKSYIRGAWEQYMMQQAQGTTSGYTSIPTASKTDVVQWVVEANSCLHSQSDMVKKAFLVCGISNNLDGSENHLVRVSEELPTFQVPYGIHDDESDPFQSSESDSASDCDTETESDSD
jgi:hypothetical protein